NKEPGKSKSASAPSSPVPAKEKQKKGTASEADAAKKSSSGNPVGAHALPAQLGLRVRTIIVDPGHGGHDPGAMHNGVVERDINLDVAKRLKAYLEKWKYKVLLTRSGNTWVSLPDRVKFGKRNRGDLFVSVHVNAAENGETHGLETYVLDFARTSSVSRLAVVENAGSGRLGDMDKVLTEMLTGMRSAESHRLAEQIQKSTLSTVKKFGYPIHDGGVKGAPFFVLVGANIPSVLVETGYCSHKKEAEQLKKSKYRQELARGIAEGIHTYARSLSGK
ncbi:MAG: N-acetylmuramoyl-L-alanine amidase, partial [Mailhella sp.]